MNKLKLLRRLALAANLAERSTFPNEKKNAESQIEALTAKLRAMRAPEDEIASARKGVLPPDDDTDTPTPDDTSHQERRRRTSRGPVPADPTPPEDEDPDAEGTDDDEEDEDEDDTTSGTDAPSDRRDPNYFDDDRGNYFDYVPNDAEEGWMRTVAQVAALDCGTAFVTTPVEEHVGFFGLESDVEVSIAYYQRIVQTVAMRSEEKKRGPGIVGTLFRKLESEIGRIPYAGTLFKRALGMVDGIYMQGIAEGIQIKTFDMTPEDALRKKSRLRSQKATKAWDRWVKKLENESP